MRHALSPLYMQLFNLIGQLEGGVKFLVDLRADLIVSLILQCTVCSNRINEYLVTVVVFCTLQYLGISKQHCIMLHCTWCVL